MRYSLRQLLVGLALVSFLIGAGIWYMRWPRVLIPEAVIGTDREIILTTSESDFFVVNGLSLRITGHLDGQATLELPWDDPDLVLEPGEIMEEISHDFYDPKAVLKYEPIDVQKGTLTIEYSFW